MDNPHRGRSPSPDPAAHLKQMSALSASQPQPVQEPDLFDRQFGTVGNSFDTDFTQAGSDLNFDQPSSQFFTFDDPTNGQGSLQNSTDFSVSHLSPHSSTFDAQSTHTPGSQPDYGSFNFADNQSLDPSLLLGQSQQPSTLDPNNLSLDTMSAMHSHSPTPPHLLPNHTGLSSHSNSPHHTPSPQHMLNHNVRPRGASESLDPSSAAWPQGYPPNGMWGHGDAFRGHRRKPSDALSDRSSHSNQASPFMGNLDGFDSSAHASPYLNPQQDPQLFNDALGFHQFTISDPALNSSDHFSPAHSIQNSPRLPSNQQPLPDFTVSDNFGLSPDLTSQFMSSISSNGSFNNFQSMDNLGQSPFPSLDTAPSVPEGQADTMSPPEINIDFAPPSRQPSFGPRQRAGSSNELQPPDARRKRAKSDPNSSSRSPSPAVLNRGRSPSLQPGMNGNAAVSPPQTPLPGSRSPSPAGRNRSASSASDTRQYLLDLADPDRPSAGASGDQKRQKHPANFQCHLCPKRFTRAYNLRSHLRTHTDERPFVCTVCGKAFARQHDRKRHEGLHSGEKKFVCRGTLKTGQPWGCSRKFARADALGRHFRSEAGRECIKPLLNEEAEERRRVWEEEQRQQQLQSQQGFVAPAPMTEMPQMAPTLPAALLQMYPDLASFDFSSLAGPPLPNMDEDYSNSSSYDPSSGNELDMSDSEMSYEQAGLPQGQQQAQQGQGFGAPMGGY